MEEKRSKNSLNMKVKYRFMFFKGKFSTVCGMTIFLRLSRVKIIFIGIKIEESFSIGRTVLPMYV